MPVRDYYPEIYEEDVIHIYCRSTILKYAIKIQLANIFVFHSQWLDKSQDLKCGNFAGDSKQLLNLSQSPKHHFHFDLIEKCIPKIQYQQHSMAENHNS